MLCDHCVTLAKYKNIESNDDKLLAFGGHQALNYLHGRIGLNLNFAMDEGEISYIIKSLREFRNFIAHRNGVVHFRDDKRKIVLEVSCQKLAKEHENELFYKMGERIYMHKAFVEWVFDWVTSIFYNKFGDEVNNLLSTEK